MKCLFIWPLSAIFLLISGISMGQTQTIRGTVIDKDSRFPLVGINVILDGFDPPRGAVTDIDGQFVIPDVPLGRQTIRLSMVGYEDLIADNLLLVSGRETLLDLELKESFILTEEIVIRASDQKIQLNNDLATVSSRSFTVEETSRYAGARNDVARMASNFAGVSGVNDARNDIVIRGNSPSGLLWRLEGIDIPSPNHFASFGSTGGPVSMLNNNLLTNSDFMTSAFPAEYGNTLSGVFDLRMRNGNRGKRQYLGQIGFNGFELGAEGPFSKKGKSTYLVNYRYSTLAVFEALGMNIGTGAANPFYQDMAFKFSFPTAKAGTFSLVGLGGKSDIELLGSKTDFEAEETDLYGNENVDIYNKTKTGIIGLNHLFFFNSTTSLSSSVAVTTQVTSTEIDSLSWSETDPPQLRDAVWNNSINNSQTRWIANLFLNKKFDRSNTIQSGVKFSILQSDFADSTLVGDNQWWTVKSGEGTELLTQAYTSWQHKFSSRLVMNTGVHFLHYDLNNSLGVDPRFGLKYEISPGQFFNLGYGLHHQMQPQPTYYTLHPDGTPSTNRDMDFTRSHHFVVGHDWNFSNVMRLKTEVYYQAISNAPVENYPSSFSMLNTGVEFGTPDEFDLVNTGTGRNYGLELTFEKFYSRQYYFLLTTSLFKSEYEGSDRVRRSTAFNGNYVVNLLGGKEWSVGRKDNTFSFDVKATFVGGRPYTPIDLDASIKAGEEIRLDDQAFSERYADYFRTDLKVSYRMNRAKVTHEFAIDTQNLTDRENPFIYSYNNRTESINLVNQLGLFIVPQYRILF